MFVVVLRFWCCEGRGLSGGTGVRSTLPENNRRLLFCRFMVIVEGVRSSLQRGTCVCCSSSFLVLRGTGIKRANRCQIDSAREQQVFALLPLYVIVEGVRSALHSANKM